MDFLQNFKYKISGNLSSSKYLVFLHGLMGSGMNWQKIASHFKEDYQILTFDQRGHGRSFQPQSGYDPKDYATDLFKIVQELGWDKINLVGHSMGGRNALAFASLYPKHLRSLLIEDISPSRRLDSIDRMKRLINSVPVPFVSKKEASQFFKDGFLQQFDDKTIGKNIAQFFYMNITESASGSADWRFYKPGILESLELGRKQDAWPSVMGLKVPTLFVYGENSDELSPEDLQQLADISHTETRCVKDAGHWVHFDQPEDFVKVTKEFFGH